MKRIPDGKEKKENCLAFYALYRLSKPHAAALSMRPNSWQSFFHRPLSMKLLLGCATHVLSLANRVTQAAATAAVAAVSAAAFLIRRKISNSILNSAEETEVNRNRSAKKILS